MKAVCLDPELNITAGNCHVLSFGINNEWSFDDAFANYGCKELSSSSGSDDITLCEESDTLSGLPEPRLLLGPRVAKIDLCDGVLNSVEEMSLIHHTDTNTTSTESSDLANPSLTQFSLDEDGRILPYVSFDEYYQAIDEAKAAGLINESQLHMYK
ncbi:hypothetical protein SK128_012395 [Halocaridina rubra]|uniref:Uncharacterized protein n=1 Tax=Halocaridina rubra TaxID=373956 RepID=A0AAN8WJY9_HALRR